jgi:hypothetical protein
MAGDTEAEEDARDLADCRPSPVVSAAAGALVFAGVGCLMLALQTLLVIGPSRTVLASSVLAVEALLGAALVVSAVLMLKLRVLPAVLGVGLAFFTAFSILGWTLFAMTRGLFSILGFAIPGLCMIAGLLSLLAIGPAQRASAARRRLRERGVSLGL